MDANNIIAYLPFDTSTTEDLCGGSWTATGSPTVSDNALNIAATTQYIKLDGSIELGGQDFTVAVKVNVSSATTSNGAVFTLYKGTTRFVSFFAETSGRAAARLKEKSSTFNFTRDTWHHVEFDYVHADAKMYCFVDGTRIATLSDTAALTELTFAALGTGTWTGSNTFIGAIDEFQIYDGVALHSENFTPPTDADYTDLKFALGAATVPVTLNFDIERRISKRVEVTADVERKIIQKWRYANLGDADDLIVDADILTDLPTTQSKTGTAFYQTQRVKCFDLPTTNEIWIKFDVYFDGSNRWRAYNEGSNGATGITAQDSDGLLTLFANDTLRQNTENICKANQLQTFLLHMISGSSDGVIESWVDGSLIYSYSGDVNHGEDFADIYLQSAGAGTVFSNVIISNKRLTQADGFNSISFDTERRIKNRTEFAVDVECITIAPIYIPLIRDHFNHYIASLKLFRGTPQRVILPKESKVYIRSGDGEPIRIFSDTDNIGKILEGDKYFGLEECEIVFVQMESSPRQIIKNFINFLVDNSSLLLEHDETTIPGYVMMNAAINYITSGEFSTIKSLTDKFLADLNNSPTYTSFLRNYCDIILDNADTGAITGFDAGGAIAKTATSVVPETSSPENWTVPANGEVRIINGLTVHFPSYDEIFYVLPVSRKYILAGLNSEWIEQSLTLIYETLGLDFNSPSAAIKDIYISFFNNIYGTLADISYTRSGDNISRIELQINMAYYEDVDTTSRDGRLVASSPHYESAGYLDRTIAHELTHAVMASNISHFLRLPEFIIEGSAEIVHGIDDLRGGAIIDLLTTRRSDLEYVLTYGTSRQLSDEEYEAEGNYTAEDTYAAGYLFLRYLAKQFINNSDTIIITGLTICDSATGDSTREELSLDTLRTVLKPLKTFFDVEMLDVIPVDFNIDINRAILAKIFLFPIFRGDS